MKHLFPIVSLCGAIVLAGCGSSSSSSSSDDSSSGDTVSNTVPVIAGDANTTASTGQLYSFTPTAGDADGDALTFSIENKPDWADFNASNGALTGTPTAYGATADINISVSDGEDTASLPLFTLTVYERVKATGQVKSYDDDGEANTTIKDDGYYQAGTPLDYERDDDLGIVTDNVTGLMWQDDADVTEDVNMFNDDYTAVYSVTTGCDAVNAKALGGYSDWRVPTIEELLTFVDFSTPDVNPRVVENTVSASITQTLTNAWSDEDISRVSWTFTDGRTINSVYAAYGQVRCVRGDTLNTDNALSRDDESGIVTDAKTGLMWQDDANITAMMDWNAAVAQCEAMTLGGYDNWRLPNFSEMVSITDFDAETVKTGFVNADGLDYFWTATATLQSNAVYTYNPFVYRFDPNGTGAAKFTNYYYTRTEGSFKAMCVRTIE